MVKKLIIFVVILLLVAGALLFFYLNAPTKDAPPSLTGIFNKSEKEIGVEHLEIPSDTTFSMYIADDLPEMKIYIAIAADTVDREEKVIYKIAISRKDNDSLLQLVRDTSETDMSTEVRFDDINFDDCRDIQLITNLDMVGNPSRHIWIYDKSAHQFILNKEYSEKLGGEMVIEPSKKQISTGFRSGMHGNSYTYGLINGKLTLLESTSEEDVDGTTKTKTTVERLVNGKMKVVSETYDDQ